MGRGMTFVLAGVTYSTQAAAKEALQRVLYSSEPGETIVGADRNLLADVLDLHPERERKIGVGVARFFVMTVEAYRDRRGFVRKNRCFALERLDGSTTDWSFTEALRRRPTPNAVKVKGAMRELIREQTQAFRSRAFADGESLACPYTGELLRPDNSDVDHESPQTFDNLVAWFLRSRGLGIDDVVVARNGDGVIGDVLDDADLAADWVEYHRENAVLRLISRVGNLSHAKRGDS